MSTAAEATAQAALEIRFGPLDLAQVRIRSIDPGVILDELTGRVATAPRFFDRAAVGLDLGLLERDPEPSQVRALIDAVRRAGMLPVGLVSGPPFIESVARALDLPVLAAFRNPVKPPPVLQAVPEPAEREGPALLHEHPVRSGQRVYARQRDLIVVAPVGAGAELMADGCVHVYGALRGRAMAGAHGAASARIFCQEFYAELVSVAGVFRVFETIPTELAGRPVQAWLEGSDLRVTRIGG
ncbi:MAG TPA: septum site-determining protein MinC [Steroidobacteraceae bacterium]|nr:septum site-determining protein MinC [Steroidobacteraceae bacterium]